MVGSMGKEVSACMRHSVGQAEFNKERWGQDIRRAAVGEPVEPR